MKFRNEKNSKNKSVKWYIPFTYSLETFSPSPLAPTTSFTNQVNASNLFNRLTWIEKTTHAIVKLDKELNNETFIIANLDMSGFYRVNYDDENWMMIAKQLMANHKVRSFYLKSIN